MKGSAMKRYSGIFDLSNGCKSEFSSFTEGVNYFRANGWIHKSSIVKGNDGKYHRHDWFELGFLTAVPRTK